MERLKEESQVPTNWKLCVDEPHGCKELEAVDLAAKLTEAAGPQGTSTVIPINRTVTIEKDIIQSLPGGVKSLDMYVTVSGDNLNQVGLKNNYYYFKPVITAPVPAGCHTGKHQCIYIEVDGVRFGTKPGKTLIGPRNFSINSQSWAYPVSLIDR